MIPRLSEALRDKDADGRPSFYTQIANDEDILKVLVQVMTGMREISPRLSKYLTTWDRYKHIWDVDKDAFMRRYAKANRALGAFETDITRYKELQQDIQSEEGITNVGFIRIDSSPLKQSLVAHCHTWQTKFTQLLNNNALIPNPNPNPIPNPNPNPTAKAVAAPPSAGVLMAVLC